MDYGNFPKKPLLFVMVPLRSVLSPYSARPLEAVVKRTVPALALAPLLTLALAGPAHSAEGSFEDNGYVLSVQDLADGETTEATLVCFPVVAGTHPRASEACEAIEEAGSIAGVRARAQSQACPSIYAPVVAEAHGAENYREEFGNSCVLMSQKGPIFDLE